MPCSVVIPCHGGADLTRGCVRSLLAQDPAPAEIIIVDNASRDDTANLDGLDPRVRVLSLRDNRGFAGGVNAGLAAVRADTDEVLILNNDTLAAPGMLRELRRALQVATGPRVGASGPVSNRIKEQARIPLPGGAREPAVQRAVVDAIARDPIVQDVEAISGLCMLLRRETLQRVGPFDERFGPGNFEDDDFCLRLRLLGMRLVIARRAFLHHEGHATFRALGLDLKEQIDLQLSEFARKWRDHPAGRATIAFLHGDLATASTEAARARRTAPNWPDADWYIGAFHEECGDAATAVRHLRAFLRRCPEHAEAQLALGLALLRRGDRDDGLALLARTAERHRLCVPTQRRTLFRLGEIAYDAGRIDEARQRFEDAIATEPGAPAPHNGLGLCLLAQGDIDAAERAFEAAAARGHTLAHTNIGICRHRRGDADGALRSFARAVELRPNDPLVRRNYEAGCAAAGRTPVAASV